MKIATVDNNESATGKALAPVRGWWGNTRTFLTEVRNELKRVTWPSKKEVYATTVVVILVSIFFGVYLWAVDIGSGELVRLLFKATGATQ